MSSAVTLGVTGIIVSGIVGPAVSAWFSRKGDKERFERDQFRRRRHDLQEVVDEGAVLLGAGETNLRLAHEAVAAEIAVPREVRDWSTQVYLLGQRLRLRLPEDDPVVVAYEDVRVALIEVGETYGDEARYEPAAATFEQKRSAFLDKAREELARIDTP